MKKNCERFKTVQERTDAFYSFCKNFKLAGHGCNRSCPCYPKDGDCRFLWLELDEKGSEDEEAE